MVSVDLQTHNLIKLMKRIGNGEIQIKIQNGIPVRAFKTTENIDLAKSEEI
jgi:hypothetical protein